MSTPARRHICPIIGVPGSGMVALWALLAFRTRYSCPARGPQAVLTVRHLFAGLAAIRAFIPVRLPVRPLNSATNTVPIGEKHERDD